MYSQKRKEYKELMKAKKITHKQRILESLQKNMNDPQKFWVVIRSARPRSSRLSNISKESWLNHFYGVFNSEFAGNDDMEVSGDRYIDACSDDLLNCNITEYEICNAVKALKSNKAAGPDGMIGEFYKYGINCIMPFFIKYFIYIFEKGVYPTDWSLDVLQPLHKKGDFNNPDNYPGIYLLNI